MRRPLVAGNWKMNGSQSMARELSAAVSREAGSATGCDVVLCPPYVYLAAAGEALAGAVSLGAQNVSEREAGAFTGEVAAPMLADVGCAYVIVGHSERRALYGETDDKVIAVAQSAGFENRWRMRRGAYANASPRRSGSAARRPPLDFALGRRSPRWSSAWRWSAATSPPRCWRTPTAPRRG